jgi:predicted Rossmann fold flavoprotein
VVVVVGAGAAGIVAAGFAARAGAKVQLVERTKDGGRKILISGGGRCNILPSEVDPGQYFTQSSPNIVKQILRSWALSGQRAFFEEELGIPLKLEEESGKLFPVSDKARDVRDGLLDWARRGGVEITFGVSVVGCRPTADGSWEIVTDLGVIKADRVILASGGLSVPLTGSDGTGLKILEVLGHTINPTHPALTPLTLTPHRYEALAGISLPVTIRVEGRPPSGARKGYRTTGGFLVTHRGWSGPAALNVSHLTLSPSPPSPLSENRRGGADLFVSWGMLSRADWEREFAAGTKLAANVVKQHLPERLAEVLFAESGVPADRTVAQLRREERVKLLDTLTSWPLPYTGDEGYKKAEVTGGGVALAEVVPQTMESRIRPGLYICGEALDVFGPIGGYNFHWAWATGRLAGMGAGSR